MKSRRTDPTRTHMGAPFLRSVVSLPERFDPARYPFNVAAFSHGIDLTFPSTVTFFVGENGSGKSTLLEALAECCGFNPEGGNRDHHRAVFADRSALAQALRLSWRPKVTEGYRETNHFIITRDFLNSPERFFKHLFAAADDGASDA